MYKIKKRQQEPEQIDLGLRETKGEKIYKVKRKISHYEQVLSLTSLWRSGLFWSVVIIDLVILLFGGYYYMKYRDMLPETLPFMLSRKDDLFIENSIGVLAFLSVPIMLDVIYFTLAHGIVGKMRIVNSFLLTMKIIVTVLFVLFCIEIVSFFIV